MVSRVGVWRTEGFAHIAADNGAWADFQVGRDFDEDGYDRFLDWLEAETLPLGSYAEAGVLDWLVLPDIVAGGLRSLALSVRYLNRCRAVSPLVLIAVQDGMTFDDLAPLVGPSVGIFLGGSTEWKLDNAIQWGRFCARPGVYRYGIGPDGKPLHKLCHYHFARANSIKRISLAVAAGADSFDGSSASRYAVTTPRLTYASRQGDLFACR